jgi:hypothetical protein
MLRAFLHSLDKLLATRSRYIAMPIRIPLAFSLVLAALTTFAAPLPKSKDDPPATEKQRLKAENNLKQIMLALHNYESAYGRMPDDVYSRDGKPLLSWRVKILPYIEEENLWLQFKMDEPWDSETNKPLAAKMPDVFKPVRRTKVEPTNTFYRGFSGKGASFGLGPKGKLRLTSITDGTSNTISVIEAGEAVHWTQPGGDLLFDAKKDLPPLGGDLDGPFPAGLWDGSVVLIKRGFDTKMMKSAITVSGGEIIHWDTLCEKPKKDCQQ